MTMHKQYIQDVLNNDIFSINVITYQKLATDIGKVADDTEFAPATNLGIPTHEITNITTSEEGDTSAVNVAYLSSKV